MDIEFHRLSGGYCAQVVRDDGVTVHVPGFDRKHAVPHDLAHFAAEHGFGAARGFWGSVAAGAMFGGMQVVSGRRPPHAAERSRRIIRANAEQIGIAEGLAGSVFQAYTEDLSPADAVTRLAGYWSVTHSGPCPYDVPAMARACTLLGDLAGRWEVLPVGATLPLNWDLPVEPPPPVPKPRRPGATIRSQRPPGSGAGRHG